MRISTLFALVFLAGTGHLVAQTVSPSVIASAGGSGTAQGVTVMWTVGELAVTTLHNNDIYLTQGFHQPPPGLSSTPYDVEPSTSLDVWPNPTANAVFVSVREDVRAVESVELVDMIGRPVVSMNAAPGATQLRLDVSAVPSGTYIVRLKTADAHHSRIVTIQK